MYEQIISEYIYFLKTLLKKKKKKKKCADMPDEYTKQAQMGVCNLISFRWIQENVQLTDRLKIDNLKLLTVI